MKVYNVIGLMSGTSLDGLDIAYCSFNLNKGKWQYNINIAETIKYDKTWSLILNEIHQYCGEKLMQTHILYGEFIGKKISDFIKKHKIQHIDLVSSHGHTVFHKPSSSAQAGHSGYTFQMGNGASIAVVCGIKVVCDFRVLDVALKGQGAPLVPIGDKLLFSEYDFCLNLGGYSNISFESGGNRVAFDICPVNAPLNYLAEMKGKSYDKRGLMAKSGKTNNELLNKLNNLSYYKKNKPKSLGREWLEQNFLPVINSSSISVEDKLATVLEHTAHQISRCILSSEKKGKILVTGGGAHNSYLILKLKEKLPSLQIIIPSTGLINFKEALVFAFLGVLKIDKRINTLHSVTGASRDSSGGVVYIP